MKRDVFDGRDGGEDARPVAQHDAFRVTRRAVRILDAEWILWPDGPRNGVIRLSSKERVEVGSVDQMRCHPELVERRLPKVSSSAPPTNARRETSSAQRP